MDLYESEAASQFILYGNVDDRYIISASSPPVLGNLSDFLLDTLLPRFDVVLSYDIGHGILALRGSAHFAGRPRIAQDAELLKDPRRAIETLDLFFRYSANLPKVKKTHLRIGCLLLNVDLIAPATGGRSDYDLGALAMLIRDWSQDTLLTNHGLATFLVTENLSDLHSLLVTNARAAHIRLPLPSPIELVDALKFMGAAYPTALSNYQRDFKPLALSLAGTTLGAVESLLKVKDHHRQVLSPKDFGTLKKEIVERECNGLVEFIEPKRTMKDFQGNAKVKAWLTQDAALWRKNDVDGLPKGYLICGPVGTGKSFLVECLAGEADVPIVKMKNFRDKWVGSTEGNLEKIFRLIRGLGRCYVFVDEADQALGRREASGHDGGLSGRVYSMIAEEMGNADSRGKVIWILASSRPDLIEVDLKRPGRIDVKIPLFPTLTPRAGFALIQFIFRRRNFNIPNNLAAKWRHLIPRYLTPGAVEALAAKAYRLKHSQNISVEKALSECLRDYQNPVAQDTLDFQIRLALAEATDREFVPTEFRNQPTARSGVTPSGVTPFHES